MYVAVAGNIGVGKSSLTARLAERYALEPVYEAVDENPYLEDFYKDMARYAFHSQIFFLSRRLEQHLARVNPGSRVIQDRTIYEDAGVFARNLFEEGVMDARDFGSYRAMYDAIRRTLKAPDLLIYLRSSVPTLQRHIEQRGRDYEATIQPSYLERLNRLYDEWIGAYDLSPKLTLDADKLDFVNRSEDLQEVMRRLEPYGLTSPILGSSRTY